MSKIARFVIWICSKFTRIELEQIISGLTDVINNRNPEVKPKDDFKEKNPNYRNFFVDPLPPLTESLLHKHSIEKKDYNLLLVEYETLHRKPLSPVKHRANRLNVPAQTVCPLCNAPATYIYFNDGHKKSQLKCKVCHHLFQLNQRFKKNGKSKYFCPHCNYALFKWKEYSDVTIYKCRNDNCDHRIKAINNLNSSEQLVQKERSSQFKLAYQFREYHFKPADLNHSSPEYPSVDLSKIHNSVNVLGLVLSFYVSFALSARKTSFILKSMFNINLSYQTVLNYAASAAFHCHSFNLNFKGSIDPISVGDETYIKVLAKHFYTFFFISSLNHKITAYHIADNRGTLPAVITMNEAARTALPDQNISFITDGNPAYIAGILFINSNSDNKSDILHHKVIGLQNLDKESTEFRPFKQIIERLNRTYKHHIKPSHGFNSINGAVSLTTLFVTHYNFLRPHLSLGYKVPIQLPELQSISNIQGKWAKILSMAA